MAEKKEKQISIPVSLFSELCLYFLFDRTDLEESIKNGLENKHEAIKKRELYSKSKTAKTEDEREKARQSYVELANIPTDFRY